MLISDLMNSSFPECTEDTPLKETYELIHKGGRGFVVVLDSSKHRVPIGVVNEHTICEQLINRSRDRRSLDAGSVMSTNIIRAIESMPVEKYGLAVERRPDAVVAVNDRRQLTGVIDVDELIANCMSARSASVTEMVDPVIGHRASSRAEIPAIGAFK
jgi:CBS domain-containing protein